MDCAKDSSDAHEFVFKMCSLCSFIHVRSEVIFDFIKLNDFS